MEAVTGGGTTASGQPGATGRADSRGPRVVVGVGVDGSPGARAALAQALVLAARRCAAGALPAVRVHLIEGAAGEAFVERARGAQLLVVGSHGRGAVRGLLLGSVALHCAMHAPCPVLVVHPQLDGPAEPAAPAAATAAPAAG